VVVLCRRCRDKAITSADRRHLQVQRRVLGMAALIEYLEVCLMLGTNAYQNLGLMTLSEMRTESALSIVN
jgi:hypothetical protein